MRSTLLANPNLNGTGTGTLIARACFAARG
jgi:hypothetical protein